MEQNEAILSQLQEFGKKLQMTRVSKGISQKKLSEMSGVAISTIRGVEKASLIVKADTLIKIVKALGYRLTFELP